MRPTKKSSNQSQKKHSRSPTGKKKLDEIHVRVKDKKEKKEGGTDGDVEKKKKTGTCLLKLPIGIIK